MEKMTIVLAYIILNNRYASKKSFTPSDHFSKEGLVSDYCHNNKGCEDCILDNSNSKFTSKKFSCYRGFLADSYFN